MSDASGAAEPRLSHPHSLEYAYKRSLGPVLGRFFTSLRDHKIEGVKTKTGRVLMPPAEYDPMNGEATRDEWVEVGPGGTVTAWTWVDSPSEQQLFDRPFAYALVKLDGADTALLHMIDVDGPAGLETGMRVTARWADETVGQIQDIACFVPEEKS